MRFTSWAVLSFTLTTPLAAALAQAQLVGDSTSTSGDLVYSGLGAAAGGLGQGTYELGNCGFSGGTSSCTLSGNYVADPTSTSMPGSSGKFSLVETWAGSGVTPIIAQSVSSSTPNVLEIQTLGASGLFTLTVDPTGGGQYTGVFPAAVFANSIGFSAYYGYGAQAPTCTGLTASEACSIAEVGLVKGATITGPIPQFYFSMPAVDLTTPPPAKAPELDAASLSGALTLLAGGLLIFRGRRTRSPARLNSSAGQVL
jgi:hypothetical protein